MIIYKLTHRYKYGKRPNECKDHTVGYYTTIEKARAVVKDFLGEDATVDNDFGFDSWTSPRNPNTEYLIDLVKVW